MLSTAHRSYVEVRKTLIADPNRATYTDTFAIKE